MKYAFIILIAGIICYHSCTFKSRGESAAAHYCGSCHLLPDPTHLTKDIWEKGIFPEMANYFVWDGRSTFDYANKTFYKKKGQTPMNDEDWEEMLGFYLSMAPATSTIDTQSYPMQGYFEEQLIDDIVATPTITAFAIDSAGDIYLSTLDSMFHYSLDDGLLDQSKSSGMFSQINLSADEPYLLDMGLISPNDNRSGSIKSINTSIMRDHSIILPGLKRPVHAVDHDSVIFISQFGNVSGELSMYHKKSRRTKTLLPLPGCYKFEIVDMDGDGLDELIAMCGQSQEGVYKIDLSDYSFERILPFPPEHGISDMDLEDLDGDGTPEIILTNGDNADYSIQVKDYHGLRIYERTSSGSYTESYFSHIDGASQVEVIKETDGSHAIVVSSFFPWDHKLAVQVLVPTDSDERYMKYQVAGADQGLWMVMDQYDIDNDGDQDLILSCNQFAPGQIASSPPQWNHSSNDLLLLINKTR